MGGEFAFARYDLDGNGTSRVMCGFTHSSFDSGTISTDAELQQLALYAWTKLSSFQQLSQLPPSKITSATAELNQRELTFEQFKDWLTDLVRSALIECQASNNPTFIKQDSNV